MRRATLAIAAFLLASASASFALQLVRGPYLQVGRATGVTVRWRTDTATDSRLTWGTTFANLNQTISLGGSRTEHELTINGLTPDAVYYYAVGNAAQVLAGGDSEHTFRTSPPATSTGPTRVWVLGDSGHPTSSATAVRNAYLAYPGAAETDVWLMLGDNAYNTGTDTEYQAAVFGMYGAILRRTVLWPTRGNHDVLFSGANNDYYEIFTMPTGAQAGGLPSGSEAYYSFDHANIHFICLDSEGTDRSVGGDMLDWLALDLAATTRTWIVAFFHHPPYTKGSHDSDNSGDSGGRMRDMRQNALPILEQGGVDLVLTGHSHSYERSMLIDGHYDVSSTFGPSMIVDGGDGDPLGDGPYVKVSPSAQPHEGAVHAVAGSSSTTGGGSLNHPVMVTSLNVLGSLVLDVSGTTLDAIFLGSTGLVRDRFRIVKGGGTQVRPAGSTRTGLGLAGASPNPFDGGTIVSFTLGEPTEARLSVVDVAGRRVTTLLEGSRDAGAHQVNWNGRDDAGRVVASGVYFLRLDAGGETRVKSVVRRNPSRD